MAVRFRKTANIAPGVKVNLNKKSASMTVGTKGAHITKSTNGSTTKTAGIPGSGLSYVDRSGGKSSVRVADSPLFAVMPGKASAPVKVVSGMKDELIKRISFILFEAPEIQFLDFDKDCLAKLQVTNIESMDVHNEIVTSKILKVERMAVIMSISYRTKKGMIKTISFEPLDSDKMQDVLDAMQEYAEALNA